MTGAEANSSRVELPLLIFALLVVAVLLTYYFPVLAGNADFYMGDHESFFEPFCRFIAAGFRRGELPMWNPYLGCGQSQLAIVSPGIFYPPHWLFGLLPYSQGVGVQMLLHQTLAAVGTFLLIERFKWGRLASVAGALVVALSGYMFALSANFTLVSTASWVPFLFYFTPLARAETAKQRLAATIGGAGSAAMLLLAGRPEIWVPAITTAGIMAVWPLRRLRKEADVAIFGAWRSLVPLVAGVLLASLSLFPAAQWARLSPRSTVDLGATLSFSANWYDFLGVFAPQALGSISQMSNPFLLLLESRPGYLPFCASVFVGPVALTLATLGLADRGWRWRIYVLAGAILLALGMAGGNLPFAAALVSHAPVLGLFRYPIKLMFFFDLLVAISAARGVYALQTDSKGSLGKLLLIACLWGSLLLAAALLLGYCQWSWFGLQQFFSNYVGPHSTAAVAAIGRSLVTAAGLGLMSCALAAAGRMAMVLSAKARADAPVRGRFAQAIKASCARYLTAATVVVLLLAGTLAANAFACTRFLTEPGFFNSPDLAADLISAQYGKQMVPPRMVMLAPASAVPLGYHGLGKTASDSDDYRQLLRQWLNYNSNVDLGVSSMFSYEGAPTMVSGVLKQLCEEHQFTDKSSDEIIARLCQSASTQFAVSQVETLEGPLRLLDPRYFHLIKEVPALNFRIYGVNNPLPFAYFINNWEFVDSNRSAVRRMIAKASFDPWQNVLITKPRGAAFLVKTAPSKAQVVPAQVIRWLDNTIELTVNAPTFGVVVVDDCFYPGWVASLDGQAVPVLCANGRFKAVSVPPGAHRLLLRFQPEVMWLGALMTAAGAFLLICSIIFQRRAARHHVR